MTARRKAPPKTKGRKPGRPVSIQLTDELRAQLEFYGVLGEVVRRACKDWLERKAAGPLPPVESVVAPDGPPLTMAMVQQMLLRRVAQEAARPGADVRDLVVLLDALREAGPQGNQPGGNDASNALSEWFAGGSSRPG